MAAPIPPKVCDRVQIVPEWQDRGDDRFESFVIEAPPNITQVRIRTLIPGLVFHPTEWIEAVYLTFIPNTEPQNQQHHVHYPARRHRSRSVARNPDLRSARRLHQLPHPACRADKGLLVAFTSGPSKRSREIRLTLTSGGIPSTSVYPTHDPDELPTRPPTTGTATELPPATLQGLAHVVGCASSDTTRQILNGVFFTPEDGGRLVATDGKRLACCPAAFPSQESVLPATACHILGHPDFTAGPATVSWIDHKDPEKRHVAVQCGRHLLVSKPLVGSYPNFNQVIPAQATQLAVIPHDRKPGLIAWLRSLGKDQCSVCLEWHKRGQLTLSHRDASGHSATMQVPVEIHGKPPVTAFNARYLADGLEIGSALCFSDELSPVFCRHPNGRFCLLMPMRVMIPAGTNAESEDSPQPQVPAAA